MPNFHYSGKISDVIEIDLQKGFYAVVFNRKRHYYNKEREKITVNYNLIIGCWGGNGVKLKSGEFSIGQRVHVEFRVESIKDVWKGRIIIKHSVVCVDLLDFAEYKKRLKEKDPIQIKNNELFPNEDFNTKEQ